MIIDLKQALAERRKAAESALRITVCLSRDLVDEFEELAAEREEILATFEMRRQEASRDVRMGADPEKISAAIDADQKAATADIDARIADVQARGTEYTVALVFALLAPSEYQSIVNAHLKGDNIDMEAFVDVLLHKTWRGVQQNGGPIDQSITWDDLTRPPEDDPESPAVLNFGEVDKIGQQVLLANRGTVAAPFSRKSSANSH